LRWIPCSALVLLGTTAVVLGRVAAGLGLLAAAPVLWVWLGTRYLHLVIRGRYDAALRAGRWAVAPDAEMWVRAVSGDDSVGAEFQSLVAVRPPGRQRARAQGLYASWLALHGDYAQANLHAQEAVRLGYPLASMVLAQVELQQGHSCPSVRAGLQIILTERRLACLGGPSLRAYPLALMAWAHALDHDPASAGRAEEAALEEVADGQSALRAAVCWALGRACLVRGQLGRALDYWETGTRIDLGASGQACRDERARHEG